MVAIQGMDELITNIRRLENLPQRTVTASAKKGFKIAFQQAKRDAPIDTGTLRKGIVQVGERARSRGKKVYQATFDKSMNNVFQRPYAGGQKRAYYPASQEYGWTARGVVHMGLNFMRNSLRDNDRQIEQTIVSEMNSIVTRTLRGGRP